MEPILIIDMYTSVHLIEMIIRLTCILFINIYIYY